MGLRWMVSPSLPLLISLSSYPSLFPPPSSHCSGQLPSITVTGRPQHRGRLCMRIGGWGGRGGKEEEMCIWMWWEEETAADIPAHGICLQVCLYVCGHAWLFFGARASACSCDMPMGQLLATHHGCCSNGTVTTAVWHLWRINIFHLEWSYYPLLVVVEIKK